TVDQPPRRVERHPASGDGREVGRVDDTLDRGLVDAVLHHGLERGAGQQGLPEERVYPGNRAAMRVESALDEVVEHRAVVSAADVVVTGPDDLDRDLRGLRD